MQSASLKNLVKVTWVWDGSGAAVWTPNSEIPDWTSLTPALPPSGLYRKVTSYGACGRP